MTFFTFNLAPLTPHHPARRILIILPGMVAAIFEPAKPDAPATRCVINLTNGATYQVTESMAEVAAALNLT